MGAGNFSDLLSTYGDSTLLKGMVTPLYPYYSKETVLLMAGLRGNYSITRNEASNTAIAYPAFDGNPKPFFAIRPNENVSGQVVQDLLQFEDEVSGTASTINGSILAATRAWNSTLPNGQLYEHQIGLLGVGPTLYPTGQDPNRNVSSALDQLGSSGIVGSRSFGLHIGSFSQGILGSMVLGGYNRGRIIGPVGTFAWVQYPVAWLRGITLEAAKCDSPFPNRTISQLYKGTSGSPAADQFNQFLDGPTDSTAVIPDPSIPYISLPLGTCEAVASNLPIT